MAEQQGICLLALKMAKVVLAASNCILCMLAASRYKMGRGRGVVTVLVAALQSGSEAGHGVWRLYMTFYTKSLFSLYSFSSQLPYTIFCSLKALVS